MVLPMFNKFLIYNLVFIIAVSISNIVKSESLGFSVDNFFDGELSFGPISVCSEKDSVGYRWRNNDWEKGNFELSTYIIHKKEHRKITNKNFEYCHTGLKNKYEEDKDYTAYMGFSGDGTVEVKVLKRCFSIIERENKLHEIDPPIEFCKEIRNHKTNELLRISCKSFTFEPNGNFIKRQIHTNLKSNAEYKDSLYISHGNCTSLY